MHSSGIYYLLLPFQVIPYVMTGSEVAGVITAFAFWYFFTAFLSIAIGIVGLVGARKYKANKCM